MKNRFTTFLKTLLLVATLGLAVAPTQASNTNPIVELHTSKGKIVLSLDAQKAPKTVANFLQYVESGFYNGTIFHRVINNFMIQGGGFTDTMQEKPTRAPIANESNNRLRNERYTIAMARTNDPNSATAQFFINVGNNSFLDYQSPNPREIGYAVFGKVIEGSEVVDLIKAVQTGNRGGHSDVPVQPVIIQKAVLRK